MYGNREKSRNLMNDTPNSLQRVRVVRHVISRRTCRARLINTHAELDNHAKATYSRKHIINTFAYSLCFIREVPRYNDIDFRF